VGHEDPAFEGSLREDERKGSDMVEMETERTSSARLACNMHGKKGMVGAMKRDKQLKYEKIIESKHKDGVVVNRFLLLVCSNSTI
jgi:hypothetical protein